MSTLAKAAHAHEVSYSGPELAYAARVWDAGAASGWIEYQEHCRCGASRWVAQNRTFHAYGEWGYSK